VATYVLIHGAGSDSWYWHLVVPKLQALGHDVVAVTLPCEDDAAGLEEYADTVVEGVGDRRDLIVVAQSLGGFTAPLAAARAPVRGLVFVNAMIPVPGETPGAWWGNTGWEQARVDAARRGGYPAEVDLPTYFLHDVPPEVAAAGEPYQRPEADVVFGSVCDFPGWPPVPVRAVAGSGDRFFPAGFARKLAADRLGVEADLLPGGHLMALSQPEALADYLLGLA
jgi:pimeloyl-ACP methyl ester carboxylesterase